MLRPVEITQQQGTIRHKVDARDGGIVMLVEELAIRYLIKECLQQAIDKGPVGNQGDAFVHAGRGIFFGASI